MLIIIIMIMMIIIIMMMMIVMMMITMMMVPNAPTLLSPTILTALVNQRSNILLRSVAGTLFLVAASLSASKVVVFVVVLISFNNDC